MFGAHATFNDESRPHPTITEAKQMYLSDHAQQRLQQRGLTGSDIDLILAHGTETRDGYFLRRADVEEATKRLQKLIDWIIRLEGKYVVVEGDTVITAYHPSKKKQKRVLRQQ